MPMSVIIRGEFLMIVGVSRWRAAYRKPGNIVLLTHPDGFSQICHSLVCNKSKLFGCIFLFIGNG